MSGAHSAISHGLLAVRRPDNRRFKFSERDYVIDRRELLWRKLIQFVDCYLERMIVPNQRGDEQRMPFVLENLFVRLEEHRAAWRWLQIQGIERCYDMLYVLTDGE